MKYTIGLAEIRVPLSVPPGVKNFGPPNTALVIGMSCVGKNGFIIRALHFQRLKGNLISAEPNVRKHLQANANGGKSSYNTQG